ncbi:YeaH/YhbH family protein [Motilimonas pumila]|uniref:UPF0229 protein D1Z90_12925 n=1 Tax=Motilimonas pumila TaxID=2303987 RepID=A0A418YDI4_9GAMM|nr:YeaH/YhbH family protein [Motilimonas pumila]RJG42561.1 YeaH/YhbH family protein [Motilimonas pumila]
MSHFIDRRLNGKNKSAVNRQRFMRRHTKQIKQAVSGAVSNRSIQDLQSSESISIPTKDLTEPVFQQGQGGVHDRVHPGNDNFIAGDKISRPQQGEGQGSGDGQASDSGEGEDNFIFQISNDEYLDLIFEDLALPNLEQKQQAKLTQTKTYRAGYTSDGVASNINLVRSLQNSLLRRTALAASKKRRLKEVEQALADENLAQDRRQALQLELENLKSRIKKVPFIDTFDLKFNNFVQKPVPNSQAVMFCIMDVSGSMDQATKEIAKRFFLLLYLFLTRSYKEIDVVFIRHHTQATEVDEQTFFYSQETGGTIVSSAIKLMDQIIQDRYPSNQWNIYAAQASDGDNWAEDSPICSKILDENVLSLIRYFTYIEITHRPHQTLWREYEQLAQKHEHFALQNIRNVADIYPVFRELFKKEVA